MNRLLVVIAVVSMVGGSALAVAFGQETTGDHPAPSEGMMGRMGEMGGMMGFGGRMPDRGAAEMQRFMNSERMLRP